MDDIIKAGVRTKVLLLSATPVNNDLKDLRNQLYFLTEKATTAFTEPSASPASGRRWPPARRSLPTGPRQTSAERKTGELLEKLERGVLQAAR